MRRLLLVLVVLDLGAQDWPQLLGPNRNGVSAEPAPRSIDPRPVWKAGVGEGFAQPVVSGGRLIVFHRRNSREIVQALDASTGKPVWTFDYPTGYRDDFGFDEGPRASPTVSGGRVFTFGAEGKLHALDFATGKKLWAVDTAAVFRAPKGYFGAAGSPAVEGNRVLLNVGAPDAGVAAFDAATGKTLWKATSDEAGYSSPVIATIEGARHGLFFTRNGLVDVDPAIGKVRFQFRWRSRSQASVNAALPLAINDLVFLSASYGTGAALLRVGNTGDPKTLWSSDDAMSSHYATPVHHNGFLYGYHGRQEMGPSLRCIELRTGKVKWDVDQFRAGSLLLAGSTLIVQRENGELILAPATPEGFKPAAKAQVLSGVVRAFPAYSNGLYYARNETALVCLRLRQ
ncbi:MAG: PQQ-binding-like beta-propeller repeat protein [Bryobacteraceae bacterium]